MTTLIVNTLSRATLLRQTLAALARQPRRPDEVVIVDNGPDSETETVAREFGARYVVEPRRGYGSARNRGLAEARGDVLYFLDDDCVAEPEWAERLWDAVSNGTADLACGSRGTARRGLAARLEYLTPGGTDL